VDFLIGPQNHGQRFVSDLASKPLGRFSPVWPQNRWRRFLAVWPQNLLRWFPAVWPQNLLRWFFAGLASKLVATVSSLASKLVVTVSPSLASKSVVGFLVQPQNQGGGGFPGLGLKISSSDVMIWASKSPRRFLGLGLKTKQASVCQLHHKTDGGRSTWGTHRDLAACFVWK
jgi:hypothetical protein